MISRRSEITSLCEKSCRFDANLKWQKSRVEFATKISQSQCICQRTNCDLTEISFSLVKRAGRCLFMESYISDFDMDNFVCERRFLTELGHISVGFIWLCSINRGFPYIFLKEKLHNKKKR